MTHEVEAIYEDGVLKPLEPLPLEERQRVSLTVNALLDGQVDPGARAAEIAWIGENTHHHKCQWIAVQGARLVGHGPDLESARAEALRNGVAQPLFFSVPEHDGDPSVE